MKLFTGDLKWDDDTVKAAMTSFGKLLDYVNPDHSALTWDGATGLLIDGKVAFNTMGDWAYGEFVKKNVVDQIGWVSFPGSDKTFVLVVDSFATSPKSPNPAGAQAWLKVLGSKSGQEAFNPLKGSIPARTDVDKTKFSAYHQWSMANFSSATLVPSTAHGEATNPAFQQAFYDATTSFVTAKDVGHVRKRAGGRRQQLIALARRGMRDGRAQRPPVPFPFPAGLRRLFHRTQRGREPWRAPRGPHPMGASSLNAAVAAGCRRNDGCRPSFWALR